MGIQEKAVCPVCQMEVEIGNVGKIFKITYYNETFYFCTQTCLNLFKKRPEDYAKKITRKDKYKDKSN